MMIIIIYNMIRVLQIKCRCTGTGEKERFDSLLQGSFSIGRDDKNVVLIHKSKMNSIVKNVPVRLKLFHVTNKVDTDCNIRF